MFVKHLKQPLAYESNKYDLSLSVQNLPHSCSNYTNLQTLSAFHVIIYLVKQLQTILLSWKTIFLVTLSSFPIPPEHS